MWREAKEEVSEVSGVSWGLVVVDIFLVWFGECLVCGGGGGGGGMW